MPSSPRSNSSAIVSDASALGPFLFGAGLLTLNLSWPPYTSHIPSEGYLLAEVLFGASILLVVLDDARARMRRLAVLNEFTVTIARAQNHAPLMQTALEKLKAVAGAKAAWFQLMEGERLVPTQQTGLSSEFLRVIGQFGTDESQARILQENHASVLKVSERPEAEQEQLKKQGIHRVLLLPVLGKKAVIGVLSFGCPSSRRHTREELEFLDTIGQTLGIAVENLRLLEQVLRSQRQWMNTFDSIQDSILAHDMEFRILKTNQALLQRLEKAPADVLGSLVRGRSTADAPLGPLSLLRTGHRTHGRNRSLFRRPVGRFDLLIRGAGKPAKRHHPRSA